MWYVYILLCDKKTYYVGITNDLQERLREHKAGQSFFTKQFSDFELVRQEWYPDKTSAAKRERQLKGWSHEKKSELIKGACAKIVD
jgi:putative endonuclease